MAVPLAHRAVIPTLPAEQRMPIILFALLVRQANSMQIPGALRHANLVPSEQPFRRKGVFGAILARVATTPKTQAKKFALSALPENTLLILLEVEMPDAPTALLDISNLSLPRLNATNAMRVLTPPVLLNVLIAMRENGPAIRPPHAQIAESASIQLRLHPPAHHALPELPTNLKHKRLALNAWRTPTRMPMKQD